jgi:cytochrome c551/c552
LIQINEVRAPPISVHSIELKGVLSNDVFLAKRFRIFLHRRFDLRCGNCFVLFVFLASSMIACIRSRRNGLALGIFLLLSIGMHAQAGDAMRGQELAAMWCSSCHLPRESKPHSMMVAPPFEEVAQRSNINAKTLAQLLMSPHPAMPDRGLSREEADDIGAYLLSLQK